MIARPKITTIQRQEILKLSAAGKTVDQIAKKLQIDGRIVSGIVAVARRCRTILATGKAPMQFPTKEDQLKELAKAWKEKEPEAEFSLHTTKGQTAYVACYKGGVVLRVGEQKKVALLTTGMAQRLGGKLIELAQWSAQIR